MCKFVLSIMNIHECLHKKMIIIFQNSLAFVFHLYFYYSVIKFSWTVASVSASQFFEKWDTKKTRIVFNERLWNMWILYIWTVD